MNLLNSVSVTLLVLLGVLMTSFVILLAVAIIFNTRAGMKYREALAVRLERLRLGKMLTALGIDSGSYLSRERAVDIRRQMERCTACTNTQECDSRLEDENIDADSLDFCNNEATLQKLARQIRETP